MWVLRSSEGEEMGLGEDMAWYEDATVLALLQDVKRRNKNLILL